MSNQEPQRWAGDNLGLPESGRGSLAKMPRRILAICIDWACASVVSVLFFKDDSTATLLVFAILQWLFIAAFGFSFGHRIAGLALVSTKGGRPNPWQALLRTLLLCLVIPVAIWGSDGRGLHDKLASSILVRIS
jgi:uncharacterized RDD family membrane protein YckC